MTIDNLPPDQEVLLRRILDDPALFIPAVFGDELWPKQVEIARAVTKYSRVAIKSCNSSGKSFLLGRLVWWWNRRYKRGECCKVDRCPGGKVLITSAGWQQIKNIVVTAKAGVPIHVGDVADVETGHEIRLGAVTAQGRGEAVLGLGFISSICGRANFRTMRPRSPGGVAR